MNHKQVILTAIKNCWPATIGFKQLVSLALKEFNIDPVIARTIIGNSLKKGELTVKDKRLILETLGYDYLNEQAANDGQS